MKGGFCGASIFFVLIRSGFLGHVSCFSLTLGILASLSMEKFSENRL